MVDEDACTRLLVVLRGPRKTFTRPCHGINAGSVAGQLENVLKVWARFDHLHASQGRQGHAGLSGSLNRCTDTWKSTSSNTNSIGHRSMSCLTYLSRPAHAQHICLSGRINMHAWANARGHTRTRSKPAGTDANGKTSIALVTIRTSLIKRPAHARTRAGRETGIDVVMMREGECLGSLRRRSAKQVHRRAFRRSVCIAVCMSMCVCTTRAPTCLLPRHSRPQGVCPIVFTPHHAPRTTSAIQTIDTVSRVRVFTPMCARASINGCSDIDGRAMRHCVHTRRL